MTLFRLAVVSFGPNAESWDVSYHRHSASGVLLLWVAHLDQLLEELLLPCTLQLWFH
jgi:hypothetical protein